MLIIKVDQERIKKAVELRFLCKAKFKRDIAEG